MDATMPMFMLKRTGRAAEFAGLEAAGAAEPELAGAVADVAAEGTALTVVPKPVGADGVDIGVPRLKKHVWVRVWREVFTRLTGWTRRLRS